MFVDVVSDIVCPWCFLGRKRLLKAVNALKEQKIILRWKPFQLNPEMPQSGKPYQAHMKTALGSKNAVDEAERALVALGEDEDIAFDFEAIKIAPNTLNTHRVIYWAEQDAPGTQDKLVGELFSRYFEQGQDISSIDVLVDAANISGMRGDVIGKLLQADIDKDTIQQDIAMARKIGVQGVACFIIDQKFVVMGAQPTDVLIDVIQQTANGFELGTAEDR